MARKATPWFWEAEQGWYVNYQGKRHSLGKHPADAKPPQKSPRTQRWNVPPEIDEAFRRLLNGASTQTAAGESVAVVLDDFLTWCSENRAATTTERYRQLIQDFINVDAGGLKFGKLGINKLSTKHINEWLKRRPTWGAVTKRTGITVVSRALNWAVKNRGLASNPIRGMEKPQGKRNLKVITSDEFETLLAAVPDRPFRDLLIVSYDCGARPFEVKNLEARHCQLDRNRAVIPADEAKGRKHTRTIYFPTERSMEVIRELVKQRPEGILFKNRLGNKWTKMAVKCRLERLDHVLGRRVTHYTLRHSFVTRKLLAGVDSHVVAKLAGHVDTKMLDAVYSHVADDYEFMLRQAGRDIEPKT